MNFGPGIIQQFFQFSDELTDFNVKSVGILLVLKMFT